MNNLPANVEVIDNTIIKFGDERDNIVVPSALFDAFMDGHLPFNEAFKSLSNDDYASLAEVLAVAQAPSADDIMESLTQDLEVQDQAIDAFMDDRDNLLEELREQHLVTRILAEDLEASAATNKGLEDMLAHAVRYVAKAGEMLQQLGIQVVNDGSGNPVVHVDPEVFINAARNVWAIENPPL